MQLITYCCVLGDHWLDSCKEPTFRMLSFKVGRHFFSAWKIFGTSFKQNESTTDINILCTLYNSNQRKTSFIKNLKRNFTNLTIDIHVHGGKNLAPEIFDVHNCSIVEVCYQWNVLINQINWTINSCIDSIISLITRYMQVNRSQ